jgi:septal ring factor EnvC (AmiA/AmiB activator)
MVDESHRHPERIAAAGLSKRRIYALEFALPLVLALVSPAGAQDVRGLEVCTAEKQMERRTSCLQSNVEFLQQALNKATREAQDKLAAASRDLAAAKAEITSLKSALAKVQADVAEMMKLKSEGKIDGKPK